MNIKDGQQKLETAGYDIGGVDGAFGPKTLAGAMAYAVDSPINDIIKSVSLPLSLYMRQYDISLPDRIAAFVGQAGEETDRFKTLVEYGDENYFKKYDGRYGNTNPGDGYKYRGRSPLQVTFKDNYEQFGRLINFSPNILAYPQYLADPVIGTHVSCIFWSAHGLNELADHGDLKAITKRVNGGYNGLAERLEITSRFKSLWA